MKPKKAIIFPVLHKQQLEKKIGNNELKITNLEKLPFWCGKINSENTCCFTHQVGLPEHPVTFQPMKLMPYQVDLADVILKGRHKKFHINKARQIGVTEIILRIIQYLCFHRYSGGKVLIIAGTREKTTKKIMSRFKQLFRNIEYVIKDNPSDLYLKLVNGTEIEGLPSNSEAIRGDTKIRCIVVDEAAHFKLIDDSVIMDAVRPIVKSNKSDLFLISTPNGQRGFFYEINNEENDYYKIQLPYTEALGWIYSEEEMANELNSTDLDADQEYRCQFTTSKNSVWGMVEAEDEDDDLEEWI